MTPFKLYYCAKYVNTCKGITSVFIDPCSVIIILIVNVIVINSNIH